MAPYIRRGVKAEVISDSNETFVKGAIVVVLSNPEGGIVQVKGTRTSVKGTAHISELKKR